MSDARATSSVLPCKVDIAKSQRFNDFRFFLYVNDQLTLHVGSILPLSSILISMAVTQLDPGQSFLSDVANDVR